MINIQSRFWFILIFLITVFRVDAQYETTMSYANAISKTAKKFHVEYREIDSESSKFIFHSFLLSLDKNGLIFTSEDIAKLNDFEFVMGKLIEGEDPEFLLKIHGLYLRGLQEGVKRMEELKTTSLDFNTLDTFYYKQKNPFVSKDQQSMKWMRWVKWGVLDEYMESIDSGERKKAMVGDKMINIKDSMIDEQIEIWRDRIKNEDRLRDKIGANFLSSVANSYDPHTDYFSPTEKRDFDEALSANKKSYGIEIAENDNNEIEIKTVVPGSPAWTSGEISEGDILLSLKPEGKGEIDFRNMDYNKVKAYLLSDKFDAIRLKLKKSEGNIVEVELTKSLMSVDENIISSYIIEGEKKIGYIALPSFYVNEVTGNGCANDIAKELIQLKREGIEGLIFDLRGNGGGSMAEAIKLCGMFINYGALFIYKSTEFQLETVKDINKGSVYDDPMIVMVDKGSCSASELFAAVMQDYHRAAIVGGNTYGKSTSQTVLPIDAETLASAGNHLSDSRGYLKLTVGKLYRCTGKSHQRDGVQVDIPLPNLYEYMDVGEKNSVRALSATPIDKKTYYYPLPEIPIGALMAKSQIRIAENKVLAEKIKNYKSIADMYTQGKIPISFDSYSQYRNQMTQADKLEENKREHKLEVRIPEYVLSLGKLAEANKKIREEKTKSLKNDESLMESFYIINDWIQTK